MKKMVILSAVALVLFFGVGAFFYKSQQKAKLGFLAKENAATFVREYSQTYGSEDAKVYLVEFFDPACETCREFYPLVKKLVNTYPGKIQLVMRYAPFHHGSDYVVKILEATRLQNKYWEALEIMYKYQPYWASHHNPQPELIWKFLPEVGVDVEQAKRDMLSPDIAKILEQDVADLKTLNVRKTPGFFVNGKPLTSFGYNQLAQLVSSEIKANYE